MGWLKSLSKVGAAAAEERATTRDTRISTGTNEPAAEAIRRCRAGDRVGGLRIVDEALSGTPRDPVLRFARGEILEQWGRAREALREFTAARDCGMRGAELYVRLGYAGLNVGRVADAQAWFVESLALDPQRWQGHFDVGTCCQAQGRFDEAIEAYEKALATRPGHVPSLGNIGICRIERSEFVLAEEAFRRVLEINYGDARAWINLAVALFRQDRVDDARQAIGRAEVLGADDPSIQEALCNVGVYLASAGDADAAISLYERVLPDAPDPNLHYGYAVPLLRHGRFDEGWEQFKFRAFLPTYTAIRERISAPEWHGQDLKGHTILLRPEAGFGDTFHFIRYAPLVKALGARVLFHSLWQPFRGIDERFEGVDDVVRQGEAIPPVDYWISLMSLPGVFGTDLQTIPNSIPYLTPDPTRVAEWRSLLGESDTLKVGLIWSGEPRHLGDNKRSIPLSRFAPLWDLTGVSVYSLQKGAPANQAADLPSSVPLTCLGDRLRDFGDTAAVIAQLDLVISVDTAVAHLAGALGKPVWILLPMVGDFRWLTERDDSPWYPTARLFRQRRRGDWDGVIERIRTAVEQRATGSDSAVPVPQRAPARLLPKPRPLRAPRRIHGLSAVTEARVGLLQYFPEDEPQGSSLEWYGEWLQRHLELVVRWVRRGGTGMEVQAGVGAHSIALAEALGGEGQIFLYEGRRKMRRALSENLRANRIGNATLMRRMLGGPGEEETLDDLQLERLDWLKMNAGVDPGAILAGAQATLWRLRPKLSIETANEEEMDALAAQVKTFGYRCWRLETPLFDPTNFYRREDDIFGGQRALALVAAPEELESNTLPMDLRQI